MPRAIHSRKWTILLFLSCVADKSRSSSPIKSGEAQATGDSSKLKGICWPGMDLFDSATAEMKRMRNQKKDGSILRRMKNTSRDVLPNEVCYFPMGEVHRVKDIYESSPEPSPVCHQRPKGIALR